MTQSQQRLRTRIALVVVLVVVVAVAAVALATRRAGGSSTTSTTADAWVLPRLNGSGEVRLSDYRGKPLVVNFFASWCTACQAELKAVAEVAGEGRVGFVGVDTNETSYGAALRMLRRAGARYPVGIGSTTQASEYRAPGLPTTVFIDKRGRVVAEAFGAVTRSQLSHWVSELASGAPLRD